MTLQTLFDPQASSASSHFVKTTVAFLKDDVHNIPGDILEECSWQQTLFSEEIAHQNWKNLLALNLLCSMQGIQQAGIASKVRQFERHPWNQSSQYFRALVAVNHALAKMPIPEVGAHLLERGAALIDLHEYCPWLSFPYHPQHVEFGLFLGMLGLLTRRSDLQELVLQLAHWQMNVLDASAKPLPGIFVPEKEGQPFQYLCVSYLFFRSAAALCPETPFATIAEAIMESIRHKHAEEGHQLSLLHVLIERWLEQFKISPSKAFSLSEQIYDPSTALIGYRSPSQHVLCSLHGEHTGLGMLRYGSIDIVSFGPQYLPLGECRGFGIEGNALTDHGMRQSHMEWRPHAFSLKGCVRMVDQPASSLDGAKFRGIWLDVVQEFKNPDFYLKTTFLGLDGWESVALSFFVKASRCLLPGGNCLFPRTLQRYEGAAQTLTFEAERSVLELRPLSFKGTMQVIPLGGGNDFWGADFLIAYVLNQDQRQYQWHIGPPAS